MAKRFQRIDTRQAEILVPRESTFQTRSKAQIIFQSQGTTIPQPLSEPPSRYDAIKSYDSQVSIAQGFGGKIVFSQPSPQDVISTYAHRAPEHIRPFGGYVVMPLYWLDLQPDFLPPRTHNKWLAHSIEGRYASNPVKSRFKCYINGTLEVPGLQR